QLSMAVPRASADRAAILRSNALSFAKACSLASSDASGSQQRSRAVIKNEIKEIGPGIVTDRIHLPLTLHDEAEVESATRMPSPCVSGGTTWVPSGDTIAVMSRRVTRGKASSTARLRWRDCYTIPTPASCSTNTSRRMALLYSRRLPARRRGHRLEEGRWHLSIGSMPGLDQGSQSRERRSAAGAERAVEQVTPTLIALVVNSAQRPDYVPTVLRDALRPTVA